MFGKTKYTRPEVTLSLGLKIADAPLAEGEQFVEFSVQARFAVAEITRRVRDDKELRVKPTNDIGITFQTWKVPMNKLQLAIVDGYIDVSAACAIFRQELVTAGHLTADSYDEEAGQYITGNLAWEEVLVTLRKEVPDLPADVVIRNAE